MSATTEAAPLDAFLGYVRETVLLKMLFCLLLDFIGCMSYALPGVGEMSDLGWAPVQAYLLVHVFGSYRAAAVGFAEELGPGTDFFPTATLCWAAENTTLLGPLGFLLRGMWGLENKAGVDVPRGGNRREASRWQE